MLVVWTLATPSLLARLLEGTKNERTTSWVGYRLELQPLLSRTVTFAACMLWRVVVPTVVWSQWEVRMPVVLLSPLLVSVVAVRALSQAGVLPLP